MIASYRMIRQKDIHSVSQLIADAFFNYPIFTEAFHNQKHYAKLMYALQSTNLKAHIKKNHLCFLGENTQQEIISCAILQHSDQADVNLFDFISVGGWKLMQYVSLPKLLSFLNALESFSDICKKNDWYLDTLVVDPKYKGQNYGSDIIQNFLIPYIKKRNGSRLSLMTNTEINCRFYEKNGFRIFYEGYASFSQNSSHQKNNTWCLETNF